MHYNLGQPHPDAVVETTSLSFADLPLVEYRTRLPQSLFKPKTADNPHGGALSKLQLETVTYACQQHAHLLPTGERCGFFLGDGVGLGKGRQVPLLKLLGVAACLVLPARGCPCVVASSLGTACVCLLPLLLATGWCAPPALLAA